MLNNITNFFNLIATKKVKTQLDPTDLLAIGTKDPRFTGNYQPTLIKYSDLASQILTGPITVGVTSIASGAVGRLLFEGTGNVVQESANLFWDETNGRLGIGTSSPQARYSQSQTQGILAHYGITNANANQNRGVWEFYTNTAVTPDFFGRFGFKFEGGVNNTSRQFQLHVGDNTTPRFVVNGSGNVLIGTTTDAGYKLDVNGTARVQDRMDVAGTNGRLIFKSPELSTRLNGIHWTNPTDTGSYGYIALSGGTGEMRMFTGNSYFPTFYSSGSEAMRLSTNRNLLINTTTDAGYKLDVNGTARVNGNVTIMSTNTLSLNQNAVNGFVSGGSNFLQIYNRNIIVGTICSNGFESGFGWRIGYGLPYNATPPNLSALLDLTSTTKGFLPPRMTSAERTAILTPAVGLMVYQTDATEGLYIYKSTGWALNS